MRAFEARARALAPVDGWFGDLSHALWDTLLTLQAARGTQGHLAEIGVWHGKSAAVLAAFRGPGELVALVDPDLKHDQISKAFTAAGIDLDEEHHLLIPERSSELSLAPLWDFRRSVRFVHIDGAHTAANVYGDVETAHDVLSDTGLCVVDDYFNPMYPQVTQALYEYLLNHPHHFRLFLCDHNKAYLCRPGAFFDYYTFCMDGLPDELAARRQRPTLMKTSGVADCPTISLVGIEKALAYRGPDWEDDELETLIKRSANQVGTSER